MTRLKGHHSDVAFSYGLAVKPGSRAVANNLSSAHAGEFVVSEVFHQPAFTNGTPFVFCKTLKHPLSTIEAWMIKVARCIMIQLSVNLWQKLTITVAENLTSCRWQRGHNDKRHAWFQLHLQSNTC